MGGWEQDIPYSMLPGVAREEDDMNSYSSSMSNYGGSNYYTDQDEEEEVKIDLLRENIKNCTV